MITTHQMINKSTSSWLKLIMGIVNKFLCKLKMIASTSS
jgi:hypothetical protein